MKGFSYLVITLLLSGIQGCKSTSETLASSPYPVYWQSFPDAKHIKVESPTQILALSEAAERFIVDLSLHEQPDDPRMLDTFIDAVFHHQQQGLSYHSDANYSVATTFRLREANCLSLTLMTYALATRAGFEATLNTVEIPEYWSRKEGYSVLNGHINLTLSQTYKGKVIASRVVDFDQRIESQQFPASAVSLPSVLGMFYNNKAAIGLITGQFDYAFAYMTKGLELDPTLREGWVNLGVLYRFTNHYDAAEQAYLRAIALDDTDLTAKENLAVLYRHTNRDLKAAVLESEVKAQREGNPYYHLILGDEAYDNGLYTIAHSHYRRAYRLDRKNHLVLSALGKSAFSKGNLTDAKGYLERAIDNASHEQDINRYTSKLAVVASIQNINQGDFE